MLYTDISPYTALLYYDEYARQFIDEDGFPVINIHEYVTPNELFLFLHHKEYMIFESRPGVYVELVWPDSEEDVYWIDQEYPREYDEEDLL